MKLLSNQISPHFKLSDSLHACASLVCGSGHKKLNTLFEQKFYTKNIVFTNTARSALGLICDTVRPDLNKKIGIPAFTCAVVATPFLARGYQIQWLETDKNGLIDAADFAAKAPNIALVVVPHIFGEAAPLKKVIKIARKHDIFVVEDGAHLIRQFQPGFKMIADAQILSFGREKVISCVSGGALLWPEKSPYHASFAALEKKLPRPSIKWVVSHALQPLVFTLSLPWWHKGGKIIPWLFRSLKILPLAVSAAEKNGTEDFPVTRMSVVQKRILARQLRQWDNRLMQAQAKALNWQEKLKKAYPNNKTTIPPLAFRVQTQFKSPSAKKEFLKSNKTLNPQLHLEDWTGVPISPKGITYKQFGYRPGQCPKAEYFARTYLTFPTNCRVTKTDIKRIKLPTELT